MFIRFGEYCLNTEEMSLQINEQSVILEPKVFAVLIYLIEHHERYISMAELHEKLWQGRCVSDAAVRRIISKIRLVLNDDHKNPKYLQSLSKRGYKLICSVSHLTNPEKEKGQNTVSNSHITPYKRSYKKHFYFICALFLFSVVTFLYFQQSKGTNIEVTSKVINTLISDKKALATSSDGRYIAFSSKSNDQKTFQIYIKDVKNETIKIVSNDSHLPLALAFSKNGQYLFFSDFTENLKTLNRIDLTSSDYKKDILVSGYYLIIDVFVDNQSNSVYFSGQKGINDAMLIYRLDLLSGEIKNMTTSSRKGVFDSKADISPDMKSMVVLRVLDFETTYEIRVLDLQTNNTLFKRSQSGSVYDVHWLDLENIVILDNEKLLKVNTKNKKEEVIFEGGHNLFTVDITDTKTFFAIKKSEVKSTFLEKRLPLTDFSSIEIFKEKENVVSLGYQSNGIDHWALVNSDHITSLISFKVNNPKSKTTYLSTDKKIKFIEASIDAPYILLEIQNRLAVFDIDNNHVKYITQADELIHDASFSEDSRHVLYSSRNNGEWQIYKYNIEIQAKELLFNNFRYIRPYGVNYILGGKEGDLHFFNAENKKTIPLGAQLSMETNTNWTVVNDKIFWSSHNLVKTLFHEMDISNLADVKLYSKEYDFNFIYPQFFVNKQKNTVIIDMLGKKESDIIKYKIQ
jgi:DNA-binding winged helix-turn-helix (wHTH) protein/Tol biopolymer transport system component